MTASVSVITTSRDRADVLDACLASIYESSLKPAEVIVVDNASSDHTQDMLASKYPQAVSIRREKNLFLAGARNLAMSRAIGDYLLIIDDDNEIDPDMISELVALCETDDSIGITGPKMYFYKSDKILLWAGADINPVSSRVFYRGSGQRDTGQYEDAVETGQVPNIMMVRRSVYEAIGGFDDQYQQTFADADYPMRAAEAGFKVMYCPKAVTWHKSDPPPEGKPDNADFLLFRSPMRAYYMSRNRVLYMKRFSTFLQYAVFMTIYFHLITAYYSLKSLQIAPVSKHKHLRDLSAFKLHLLGSWHGFLYGLTGHLSDYYKSHEAEPTVLGTSESKEQKAG